MTHKVKVRYNTKHPHESSFEWRLLVDDEPERLVNKILINCPSYTSSEFIEGHGLKYHISTDCESVELEESGGKITAVIK
jgi:hypothetical protein